MFRKSVVPMAVALGPTGPTDAGNIRNRITSGEKFAILETSIHHPIDAVHLVHETLDGVG